MKKIFLSAALSSILLGWSPLSFGETTVIESENFSLSTGAYVSSYFLMTKLDYEFLGINTLQASSSNLLRLETKGTIGEKISFEIHNRLFLRTSNASNSGLGLGATTVPKRTVDLRSEFINDDGLLVEHDLDRLAFTWFTPVADFTIGRQAISWGHATFFPVNDLWTQFSPFESDTSQKRGVDAIRAIAYPSDTVELDLVVVDRGEIEDLSGGLKVAWTMGNGEYFLGAARNYETLDALAGVAMEIGDIRAHLDINLPFEFEESELLLPSASIGADYFSSNFLVSGEYFFNGYGVEKEKYITNLSSARSQRGQSYLIGEHYLALNAGYLPIPELTLNVLALTNLLDPSSLISPTISYQATEDATISLGGFFAVGERPITDVFPPSINSEFGLAGYSAFLQLSTFL